MGIGIALLWTWQAIRIQVAILRKKEFDSAFNIDHRILCDLEDNLAPRYRDWLSKKRLAAHERT